MSPNKAKRIVRSYSTNTSEMFERARLRTAWNVAKKAIHSSFYSDIRDQISTQENWENFRDLPIVDKRDFQSVGIKDLFAPSEFESPIVFSSTSGSTGPPSYFPRNIKIENEYSVLIETYINTLNNECGKLNTLVLITFGMGVWIGGLISYRAFEIASQRNGWPISILATGINKKEIERALERLAPNYERILFVGYPPFIKDIVDEYHELLSNYDLGFIFAAESFTENFRNYLISKVRLSKPEIRTLNIYGTAEIGAMAFETPLAIHLRRLLIDNKKLYTELLGTNKKVPTITQYNPDFVAFEEVDGEVIVSANSAFPFLRYNLHDNGGVFSYKTMIEILNNAGVNFENNANKAGIPIYELPFVFVHERNDLSTTLYGLQIYPQSIKDVFLDPMLSQYYTGKFSLETKFDLHHDQYLQINVEEKKASPTQEIQNKLTQQIIEVLLKTNSEYQELSKHLGKRSIPKIVSWPYESEEHFNPSIKQKWVIKE